MKQMTFILTTEDENLAWSLATSMTEKGIRLQSVSYGDAIQALEIARGFVPDDKKAEFDAAVKDFKVQASKLPDEQGEQS